MDAPAVQYATTSDGVSIAWAEAGNGPALLYCPAAPFTHVQEMFVVFEAFFGLLAGSFRQITFDARGTGMSERDVADVSTATLLLDARAVIDAAKLERFVVFGDMGLLSSSMALHVATVLPDRVTHLVLESPFQNMRELADTPYARVGLALAEADWGVFVQTSIRVLGGWDAADSTWVDPMAKAAAGWADATVGLQYERLRHATDVGDLLARVSQPTLVVRNEPNLIPARCCQRIAAKIPGAQFRQYADPTFRQQAELMREFVGLSAPSPPPDERVAPSAVRIILFTDIVDSTALTERMGDTAFRMKARDLDVELRRIISAASGTTIDAKTLGDGVLATFPSASQAIDAALAFEGAVEASGLQLHVGLHAGDVIREEGNVFGGAVNIAARISALSAPGEVLVSDIVRGLARTSAGVVFEDRGEHALKGVADAQRVFAVRKDDV
jgi:class 3 adenylate cyclase